MSELAMFPLGTVLVPSGILPLHIFEDRYRQMINHVLEGDREFGVVMIERGHEVGGDDVRADVGTVAQILDASELPDGRWAVVAVGTRRFRVGRWLEDRPYPRAVISDWPDPPPAESLDEPYQDTVAALRRTLGLATELGGDVAPATTELAPDPVLGSYQVVALAPLAVIDKHRLLCAADATERLALARELLEDYSVLLRSQLDH